MSSIDTNYIFDTNIFDKILDNQTNLDELPKNSKYFVTHIQKDEITKISKPEKQERKNHLLEVFNLIEKEEVLTESFVWGASLWGKCKWGAGKIFDKLKMGNDKHIEDALIGETAIKNNLVLVTNDKDFLNKVVELGGQAISFEEFMRR